MVFQGHPSNFKVTRYKTSTILTQIGRFRTIGQPQLSNPSDLPCLPSLPVTAERGSAPNVAIRRVTSGGYSYVLSRWQHISASGKTITCMRVVNSAVPRVPLSPNLSSSGQTINWVSRLPHWVEAT